MVLIAADAKAMLPKIQAATGSRDLERLLRELLDGGLPISAPQLQVYTVATAPSASPAGRVAYFSNGAAGSPVVAWSDGTNWKRADTGATIAAV